MYLRLFGIHEIIFLERIPFKNMYSISCIIYISELKGGVSFVNSDFYIESVTKILKVVPSRYLYRIFAGAESGVEFVNKDIEYLISILYLADTKKLCKYLPKNVSPATILPRVGLISIMAVKYRDVDGLGECSDFAISIFGDYKEHRKIGYFPLFMNDNELIVKKANEEWKWPKKLGDISWEVKNSSVRVTVASNGHKIIEITLENIGSRYNIDQMTLPSLLANGNKYKISTILLKRRYTTATASLKIPKSSSISGFPVSNIFLDSYFAKDSEMNVLSLIDV